MQMYDLHNLGWHSFQQLCLTIARETLGQTVESFLDSNDGGRDGAFAGHWRQVGHAGLSGRFVIQCKFTNSKEGNLTAADLADEIAKAGPLVKGGKCDCYVLICNAGLSGKQAEKIEDALKGVGVKQVLLLGSTWVCQQIRESKRLRMLVPRIYGLGDLSQILDERAYAQARALLASLREDLSKIVVTNAYKKAAAALDKHGFVLLIGEPAAGKTTIASLLAMAALDQWNASTLKLDDPGKVVTHWNPDEPSQFFWVDDAFGVTQYESYLARGWNHILPQVAAMLRKGTKIVMTSRDYIYNRARKDLKESAFPLMQESQVVIDVHNLTAEEKRQILYNHLRLGRQPRSFKTGIKPLLESVSRNPRFIPETARRLGDPVFTAGLTATEPSISEFVEKQQLFLRDVLHSLDSDSKAALALIYMRNDLLESPVELQQSENHALMRLNSSVGACLTALESLNGSLVQFSNSNSVWRFKHPTIGDAFAAILADSPELLGIYVQGSTAEKLVDQITCGDVGLEHATVVPKSLFPLVLSRLDQFTSTSQYKSQSLATWSATRKLHGFLARRCSKDFLTLYVKTHPELFEQVAQPGLFLYAVSEVDVAVRLHANGLLPEDKRLLFVAKVTDYAVSGEDVYALRNGEIQSVFKAAELDVLRQRVRNELVPRLNDVRYVLQSGYSPMESPADYMESLLDNLRSLEEAFLDEPAIVAAVERERDHVRDWIAEKETETPEEKPPRAFGELDEADDFSISRSIFDDVDADVQ